MDWRTHARTELAAAGHRSGGARDEVIELLGRQRCVLTAQEIHAHLRGSAGLASVYRALEALTGLGLVHRIERDGTAAYEPADPTGEHHHHAICDHCGATSAFEDPALERRIHAVAEQLGYTSSGHDVVLRGTCPRCARGQV